MIRATPETRPRRLARTLALIAALAAGPASPGVADPQDTPWHNGLRQAYFGDRPILETGEVIRLQAPERAEDAAFVPIRIEARIPQTPERYIRTVTLIIDKNPSPVAGVFHFTPRSGRADLAMRVRINEYTPIRAIAETSEGKLYMSQRFIKASGGCSAPVGTDLDEAMARLGQTRLRLKGPQAPHSPLQVQLAVRHPNLTGLQMDQVTRLYAPPRFVNSVEVSFEGSPVFSARTDISISENPNFRFYFVPDRAGELKATIHDTSGALFTKTLSVSPPRSTAGGR